MTTTQTASHRCEFPVQPPSGSFADPGPCACGKTYLASIAEQRAAEAGLVVVDRDRLADALTRLDITVPVIGPAAGFIDADAMADALMEALAGDPR